MFFEVWAKPFNSERLRRAEYH